MPKSFLIQLLFISFFANAQKNQIDSLINILRYAKNDTNHVNALSNLAWNIGPNNPDTAIIIGNQALELSKKINWETGEAKSELRIGVFNCFKRDFETASIHFNKSLIISEKLITSKNVLISKSGQNTKIKALANIANIFKEQGNFTKALENYLTSLKLAENIEDKKTISQNLYNIGSIYSEKSNYPKALEYYFKCLKIAEDINDEKGIGRTLMSIGLIYKEESNYIKSNEYYFKSLKIAEKTGDIIGIESNLGNIANIFVIQTNYEKALEYYFKVLQISEKIGDKKVIGNTLGSIAGVYDYQTNSKKALEYYTKSLENLEQTGDKQIIAQTLGNIGIFYTRIGKYKEAEHNLKKALIIAKESEIENIELNIHNFLTILYQKINQPSLAFEHYKKYITLRDSIFSKENSKKIMRSEMNYEYEKKQAIEKAVHQTELKQQKAIADEKSRKQQIITWSIVFSLLLVTLFTIFVYRSLKTTRKQKVIIEEQKHLVEEKHKEITDSINYAERIQRSLLASKELLNENLNESFVFFKPKDVVSGDFYWATTLSNNQFALVTADSTGHGVPGAIMSILNISCLKETVKEGFVEPSQILNHTRNKIIEILKKDGSLEGGKDGMDCSLVCFDFTNNKLTYSAANNPIWIIRGKQIMEFSPDKMPVGKHDRDTISFTQHTIELQKNDMIYTLTDGMPDQFGGPKGKKYMYKQLKELLISISDLSMSEQKEKISESLNSWIGELEQVDDITIIGIKV
ncbi:MAG TPA: tetratricopeptide repeat protein [Bacteroidia bacterium]|nr:tetratricopeptide repeat protein [Bacteroidia bacterium]